MITVRKSDERGHAQFDWLDSRHSFSFGDYRDPSHMGFHALRVINEDHIAGGGGFGSHPHRDMEILTYVVSGVLQHKDNLGNSAPIRPGELQRMSAGTGIVHSEFNASKTEPVHLLQIWLLPDKKGLWPGYEQKQFSRKEKLNRLCLVASSDARDNSLTIHQDVKLFVSVLETQKELKHEVLAGRAAWIQVIRGALKINGQISNAGDGVAVEGNETLRVEAMEESEFLLFDLA
ncbi:MAG: pirin family protein [Verrucomicrobiota bacterium]